MTRRVMAALMALLGLAFILLRGHAIGYIAGVAFIISALTFIPRIERK